MPEPTIISAAVEGIVDEAVVRKLITHAGGHAGTVYGKNGKTFLHQKINGYNNAARYAPWIVLVDLDRDEQCAPLLRKAWLAEPAPHLCFRIAVPQVEAWLMADAEMLSDFMRVARIKVAVRPELLEDAKEAMVNLARTSRRKAITVDMVPRTGSGRQVGPAYTSRLIEFVELHWRPDVAARHAESLRRAITCLEKLVEETGAA